MTSSLTLWILHIPCLVVLRSFLYVVCYSAAKTARNALRRRLYLFYTKKPKPETFQYSIHEDPACQRALCLFGDLTKGYCHKCVPSKKWTTCDRLAKLQDKLYRKVPQQDYAELLRVRLHEFSPQTLNEGLFVPDSHFLPYPPRNLGLCKRFPTQNIASKQKSSEEEYVFNVIAGGMLVNSVPNVVWKDVSFSGKKKARFGLAWGNIWKYRTKLVSKNAETVAEEVPTTLEEQLKTESAYSVTRFPKDAETDITDDTALLFLRTSFTKSVADVEKDMQTFSNQFVVLRPPLKDSTILGSETMLPPLMEFLKVVRINAEGQILEEPFKLDSESTHHVFPSSCVIINCVKEFSYPLHLDQWFNVTQKEKNNFYNALKQKYQNDPQGKDDALAKQALWIKHIASATQHLIQDAATLSPEELKEQERLGKLKGLSKTCKAAAQSLMGQLKAEADKLTPASFKISKALDNEDVLLEDVFADVASDDKN